MLRQVVLAALLLATAACVSPEEHRKATGANAALQATIASMSEHQRKLAAENESLRKSLEGLRAQAVDADALREKNARLDELLKRYQQGEPGSIPGVEFVRTPEGMAFRVLGGVLFAPGRIEITDQGQKTLLQLIPDLKRQGKKVRVDGHTDDQPIVHSQWGTNLRLSVERSLAVADFLIKNGLDAASVGVAGYGEYRPTEPGSTEASRQRNRRVELLMLDQ